MAVGQRCSATGEALLTDFATRFGPKDLRDLAEQVVNAIDPDGSLPNDELNHDRRHVAFRPTPTAPTAGSCGSPGLSTPN